MQTREVAIQFFLSINCSAKSASAPCLQLAARAERGLVFYKV